jgi:hypothetical protein
MGSGPLYLIGALKSRVAVIDPGHFPLIAGNKQMKSMEVKKIR